MLLDEISVQKLNLEIFRLDAEIKKVLDLQKRKQELEKIVGLLAEYLFLLDREKRFGGVSDSPFFTAQSRRRLEVMKRYPLLSLSLGSEGIVKMADAYESDEALFEGFREDKRKSYAEEDEIALQSSGYGRKMEEFLAQFKIENEVKEESIVSAL